MTRTIRRIQITKHAAERAIERIGDWVTPYVLASVLTGKTIESHVDGGFRYKFDNLVYIIAERKGKGRDSFTLVTILDK